jgi:hypothetical protein
LAGAVPRRREQGHREPNAHLVVIVGKLDERPTQVRFAQNDDMVNTLPPERADQPFRKAVLPRRAG